MTAQEGASVAPDDAFQRATSYQLNRPKPDTLRLWTLQEREVWDALRREGQLFTDPIKCHQSSSYFRDYRDRYDWLRDQMRFRVLEYEGHYPWWAWVGEKPDLRKWFSWQREYGSRHVRLELSLPPERVLRLSDDGWTWVLNGQYLTVGEDFDEWERWNTLVDEMDFGPVRDHELPSPWGDIVRTSWQGIFNTAHLEEDYHQAVFERLDLSEVVAVTEFTGRDRK